MSVDDSGLDGLFRSVIIPYIFAVFILFEFIYK